MLRLAQSKDKIKVLQLLFRFHEYSQHEISLNYNKLSEEFDKMVENSGCFLLVREENNNIVGILCASFMQPLFSTEVIAIEYAWFIDEEYRGSVQSIKMVRKYEQWAKENGASFVMMADIQGMGDLSGLYERLGYTLSEQSYIKRI